MPLFIVKYENGFKVCDITRCFSKKPLTLTMAKKQRIAINISKEKGKKKFKF